MSTGRAFLFSLVSLVEKGKQCYEQTTCGNQQADYPQENHNDFISRHDTTSLPMYSGKPVHWFGRLPPPVMGSMYLIITYCDCYFNQVKKRKRVILFSICWLNTIFMCYQFNCRLYFQCMQCFIRPDHLNNIIFLDYLGRMDLF